MSLVCKNDLHYSRTEIEPTNREAFFKQDSSFPEEKKGKASWSNFQWKAPNEIEL